MQHSIDKHGRCGNEQPDRLITVEETALLVAAGRLLLLNSVALKPVVHGYLSLYARQSAV